MLWFFQAMCWVTIGHLEYIDGTQKKKLRKPHQHEKIVNSPERNCYLLGLPHLVLNCVCWFILSAVFLWFCSASEFACLWLRTRIFERKDSRFSIVQSLLCHLVCPIWLESQLAFKLICYSSLLSDRLDFIAMVYSAVMKHINGWIGARSTLPNSFFSFCLIIL